MAKLKASQQGIAKIKQARNEKGLTVDDPRWLVEASKVLEPKKIWQEGGPYAHGCSEGNWKRFLYGKATVNTEVFKAFCRVLGVSWEEIVDRTVVAQDFAVENTPDKWQKVCRRMLLEQKRLSSNKLMPRQMKRDLIDENIYVDLTLVQQEQIQKVGGDSSPEQGSLLYESTG